MNIIIKKTKAAILVKQKKPLVISEIELPNKLLKGQILVQMLYSGICGSQLGEIEGIKGKDKFLPHLLGHEGIAKVLQVGPSVKKVKKGNKVLLHWMPSSGINANPPIYKWKNKKLNAGYLTTFNNHAIVSENRITRIRNSKNDLDMLLLGCTASTAIGSVEKLCKVNKNHTIAVAGCGPIGLYIIRYLKFLKVKNIISIDINLNKLKLSKKYGATEIILNSKKNKYLNNFQKIKNKIDYFFECSGNTTVISEGYESLNQNGSMILIGVPSHKKKAKFNTLGINLGKNLIGSKGGKFNASLDLKKFSKIISLKNLGSKNFILKKIQLNQINNIFYEMKKNRSIGKSIIKF
tara:strand:+ start:387 stop:1436 length:1050 start_codon:yes stop_codon:yes gene_type:complete